MAYVKRDLVDNKTPLDKELFDHMQDGIAGALPLDGGGIVKAAKSNVLTINNTANSNTYYVIQNNGANRATFGFVRSFACVSNEQAGGARIGVSETGVPQYRTTSNESTAQTLLHTGNALELLEALGIKQAIVDAVLAELQG